MKNTICFATRQRQESAAALADEVDAIVVIGGRNSSNTTRLADICAARLPHHHAEAPGGWIPPGSNRLQRASASPPEPPLPKTR